MTDILRLFLCSEFYNVLFVLIPFLYQLIKHLFHFGLSSLKVFPLGFKRIFAPGLVTFLCFKRCYGLLQPLKFSFESILVAFHKFLDLIKLLSVLFMDLA